MPVADPNTFTGALLDRAADGRRTDAAWVHEQLSHPGARAVLAADEGMRVRDGHLALIPLSEAPAPVDDGVPLLLGLDDDGPVFAIDEGPATEPGRRPAFVGAGGRRGEPPPTDDDHLGLREAAQTLDQAESGLAAYAAAMLNWHRSHRFCANCAAPTDVAEAGMVRIVPELPRPAPPARGPGGDHGRDRRRRARAAGPPEGVARAALLGAGRVRLARREPGGGGGARGVRGGRRARGRARRTAARSRGRSRAR